jgi:hypothetical protein
MFVQGNQQLLARLAEQRWPLDAKTFLRLCARVFVEFGMEDVQRYQLLFQRTIPNFEPSADAYAIAMQVFDAMHARFEAAGLGGARNFDIWTALVSGLSAQQNANDPGGDRWLRLVDDVVDMYLAHTMSQPGRRIRKDHK